MICRQSSVQKRQHEMLEGDHAHTALFESKFCVSFGLQVARIDEEATLFPAL